MYMAVHPYACPLEETTCMPVIHSPALGPWLGTLELGATVSKALADVQLGLECTLVVLGISSSLQEICTLVSTLPRALAVLLVSWPLPPCTSLHTYEKVFRGNYAHNTAMPLYECRSCMHHTGQYTSVASNRALMLSLTDMRHFRIFSQALHKIMHMHIC